MRKLTVFGIVYMILLFINLILIVIPAFSWINLLTSIFMIICLITDCLVSDSIKSIIFKPKNN